MNIITPIVAEDQAVTEFKNFKLVFIDKLGIPWKSKKISHALYYSVLSTLHRSNSITHFTAIVEKRYKGMEVKKILPIIQEATPQGS